MAGSGKRGGGDRVLESRHLVGLFSRSGAALRGFLHARLRDGAHAVWRGVAVHARGLAPAAFCRVSLLAAQHKIEVKQPGPAGSATGGGMGFLQQ